MNTRILTMLCVTIIFPVMIFAQKNDSVTKVLQPVHRNVIKFNPTPMILWSWKNVTFSYERILSPKRSLSIEMGYLEFPKLINDTLIKSVTLTSSQKWGLNITIEYRFYITGLNTRPTPAGLYIGPYLTHYQYHFKNGLDIFSSSFHSPGTLQGDYWSFNLGAELGYQFVFGKRWTIDLVMVGPSISYYGGKTQVTGSLDAQQILDLNEELYNKLLEKYPVFQSLSLDKSFEQTGKLDIFRMGFRYLAQVGFHF